MEGGGQRGDSVVKGVAALAEDPNLVPSIHSQAAHNYL